MVSISTLFAFWIVALALLWHRCFRPSRHSPAKIALLSIELFVMVAACIGECAVGVCVAFKADDLLRRRCCVDALRLVHVLVAHAKRFVRERVDIRRPLAGS